MKTLVVEDDPFVGQLVEEVLRARGHDVTLCADAEAAWKVYRAERQPLVFLDWLLGDLDGLDLCRRMRELPEGDRSVIVVVTVKDRPEDLRACLDAGADDYLAKPLDIDLFGVRLTIAERAVETRRREKDAEAKVAEMLVQLQRANADMLAVLDETRLGSVVADEEGAISFVSQTARKILDMTEAVTVGRHWDAVFPFPPAAREQIGRVASLPAAEREKVSVRIGSPGRRNVAIDVEVRDDPRDARRKLFFLYDVTEVEELRAVLSEKTKFEDLVGHGRPMQAVFEQIQQVAAVDSTVMIEGETGTGKELVARAIHSRSHRAKEPFLAVNCAGLTESVLASQLFGHKRGAFTGAVADQKGLVEEANGGTLFLDEIGDIPPAVQTSLLRFLQEKEITRLGEARPRKVDVRVLAATHRNLATEVERGAFRQDLLYRIRVARVTLPPLRDRREDIPLLAGAFLTRLSVETGKAVSSVGSGAMRLLMDYPWPGNVRELRSAIECAVIRCQGDELLADDLPPELSAPAAAARSIAGGPGAASVALAPAPGFAPPPGPLDPETEKERIRGALEQTGGNRSRAAKLLGMSRATFYRRLEALEIDLGEGGGANG